ncbi:acyl-CoA dehydrogenase family protein [Aldersonia sp. NBC_00410]|uniref:acyl-CoA dehydrogenase family protein n=1 Tax=Aldersonia sp. NBC_00410 TaxID=2975954 RepID=UPI002258EC29|nr:acyl-CoA dehydrogenase family protein [Aldersonia sp. NBC_00410]MCX5045405.1 acyl-CoA dehydrogenase family protein [Aldersonia sp. NBC_00410]
MQIELSAEATEYGSLALRAFEAAGGDELIQRAELDPAGRADLVTEVFDGLGAWELDPRGDAEELEAAAALCRSAGYWAVPYPVAERLARPADLDVDGLVVVTGPAPKGAISDVDLRWAAVTLDGERSSAVPRPTDASPRTTAFVASLDLQPLDKDGAADVALGLVLPCWTLLGMLDRALDLTRSHVLLREQFGQPLARLQSVQFQLTDAELERSGLDILAKYALWSVQAGRPDALADALSLRVAALDAADTVFRVAHQLHGASGFCDETQLSWLSRYSLPLRRLPLGPSGTLDELTRRIGTAGLTGLFGDALHEGVSDAERVS